MGIRANEKIYQETHNITARSIMTYRHEKDEIGFSIVTNPAMPCANRHVVEKDVATARGDAPKRRNMSHTM